MLIGQKSKIFLNFAVRNKGCGTCCQAKAKGPAPQEHSLGFAVRVRSAGQKYGPTCHQRDRADVTESVTLVRLSSLGQHVGVLALAGYKRRKSARTAGPIGQGQVRPWEQDVAVSMIQNIGGKGNNVGTLVMDNDATTIAKVRQIAPQIQKSSKWQKPHQKEYI